MRDAIAAANPTARIAPGAGATRRNLTIAIIAFLTLVDLFATQALLPALTAAYGVSPAAMSLAVNACTLGMAVAGLAIAFFSRHIDRRKGVVASLTILALPTLALAIAPDLATFAALRILQGLCMAAAFSLTLAYLSERCSASAAAGALAAYVTGNVASNLIGRLISASVADHLGLASNFVLFAGLNLVGALIAFFALAQPAMQADRASAGTVSSPASPASPLAIWGRHLTNPPLRAAFGIGFCILFAFIGTFSFVNFVLVASPLNLSPMALGLVYFVFLPSILATPLAGRAADRFGARRTVWGSFAVAGLGLPLLLLPALPAVLAGLALVALGTFFAQATATGFVGRAATSDRGAAGGLYLASYFAGGLAGSAILGPIFDQFGWAATVAGIGLALALAAFLAGRMRKRRAGVTSIDG